MRRMQKAEIEANSKLVKIVFFISMVIRLSIPALPTIAIFVIFGFTLTSIILSFCMLYGILILISSYNEANRFIRGDYDVHEFDR